MKFVEFIKMKIYCKVIIEDSSEIIIANLNI